MILASSVLEKVISIRPRIRLSTDFHMVHDRLKKPTTGFEAPGRVGGRPSDGELIGE
jgi:hypothetical protein